jgi:bla regulator protein BlaR1
MTHIHLFPVLNHLWQSTLGVAVAWILARFLADNRAAVRYAVWLAASLKFLVPFAALIYIGERVGWRTAPLASQPGWISVAAEIGRPFLAQRPALPAPPAASHSEIFLPVLAAVWFIGFVASVVLWFWRWRQIRAIRQAATPLALDLPVPVLSSPSLVEPGIFGIFRPVLLLPEGILERVAAHEFDAIVAHEICHVRRRDNLTAAAHLFVEAVFWFFPLVRWMRLPLMAERERACDESVLRAGTDPAAYAEAILRVCKLYVEAPLTCVSGVTGSDLKGRIARILSPPSIRSLGAARTALLALAAAAAIAGPVTLGLVNPTRTVAQSPPAGSRPVPLFESVSIRPSVGDGMPGLLIHPSSFTMTHMPVRSLVDFAYDVKSRDQLSGVPDWLNTENFDLDAKESDAVSQQLGKLSFDEAATRVKLMLQTVLADRFGLKVSYETKILPTYSLVVAAGGSKLTPASEQPLLPLPPPNSHESVVTANAPPPTDPATGLPILPKGFHGMVLGRGRLVATAAPVRQLADSMSGNLGHEVLDQTGLTGLYDFTLKWTPIPSELVNDPRVPGNAPDPNGPALATALEEQLGLRLLPQDRAARVMVIDHVERPAAN